MTVLNARLGRRHPAELDGGERRPVVGDVLDRDPAHRDDRQRQGDAHDGATPTGHRRRGPVRRVVHEAPAPLPSLRTEKQSADDDEDDAAERDDDEVEAHVDPRGRGGRGQGSAEQTAQAPHGVHRGEDDAVPVLLHPDPDDVLGDVDDGVADTGDEEARCHHPPVDRPRSERGRGDEGDGAAEDDGIGTEARDEAGGQHGGEDGAEGEAGDDEPELD